MSLCPFHLISYLVLFVPKKRNIAHFKGHQKKHFMSDQIVPVAKPHVLSLCAMPSHILTALVLRIVSPESSGSLGNSFFPCAYLGKPGLPQEFFHFMVDQPGPLLEVLEFLQAPETRCAAHVEIHILAYH